MNNAIVERVEAPRVGAVVSGKYRIERELGVGCCGRVYCAHNLLLARDVAIKFMREEHAANPEFVDRFMREARATNHVRHPHVVDVLDVGLDGEVPYIVQELLEGEDLADYLARKGGRLSVRAALERMLPVIDGVAYAHSRGVVHRDLKPANVFLARTPDGIVPKVLDFGISKVAATELNSHGTVAGTFMGTPAFTAPEQILHFAETDARADVWSLGVMLYELLAGDVPFESCDTPALLARICTQDPIPLDSVAPGLPSSLVAIVHRCLQRDPAARFSDGGALVAALRELSEAPALRSGRLQTVAASIAPMAMRASVPAVSPYDEVDERFVLDAPLGELNGSLRPVVEGLTASRAPRRLAATLASIALASAAIAFAAHRPPRHPVEVSAPPPITALQPVAGSPPQQEAPVAPVEAAAAVTAPTPAARVTRERRARPTDPPTPSTGEVAPPVEPSPEHAADAAAGESAGSVVERALEAHSDEIRNCIEHGQDDSAGRLTVRLVIAPGGGVRSVTTSSPEWLRDVATCIAREMGSWRLVVPGATGDSIVTKPFDIDPDAQ